MKNRVKEILEQKGFKAVQLTDTTLHLLKCETPHRFNKIIANEVEMTQSELIAFKRWLELESFEQLFESEI